MVAAAHSAPGAMFHAANDGAAYAAQGPPTGREAERDTAAAGTGRALRGRRDHFPAPQAKQGGAPPPLDPGPNGSHTGAIAPRSWRCCADKSPRMRSG